MHTQISSTIPPGSLIVVLVCLFIVVFVLWRKGFVLQQPGRIYSHLSRVNSIYGNLTNFRNGKSRRQTMAAKKRMSAAAFPVRRLVLLLVVDDSVDDGHDSDIDVVLVCFSMKGMTTAVMMLVLVVVMFMTIIMLQNIHRMWHAFVKMSYLLNTYYLNAEKQSSLVLSLTRNLLFKIRFNTLKIPVRRLWTFFV